MYFQSRVEAGRMLAGQLAPKYRYENCAVVAMTDGGAIVGAEIASALHCVLTLLTSAEILLPREPEALAGITADGIMTYNSQYSDGEIAEFNSEYFNYIEAEKMTAMHELNRLQVGEGTINKRLLKGHTVIVVSDGFKTGFPVDIAAAFLKPIAIDKLVMATPLSSVKAIDRMHILADELHCLSVVADYRDTAHYYDVQDIPEHQIIMDIVQNIVTKWL